MPSFNESDCTDFFTCNATYPIFTVKISEIFHGAVYGCSTL
ncbi:hypothetical protein [Methanobrevibacter ruminantium]|nr:hypothetical protein [Methanobrevibacter ruminantium]